MWLLSWFLPRVASGLLIRNLNLHPDFCKAASWQSLLLKVLIKPDWNWAENIFARPMKSLGHETGVIWQNFTLGGKMFYIQHKKSIDWQ